MNSDTSSTLSKDELRLANIFKALGNPIRLEILLRLAQCDRCICGDLVAALPLAQSTVSQHLKVLKQAGLIRGEIEGPATCYCIDHAGLDWFLSQARRLFSQVSPDSQNLIGELSLIAINLPD